MHTDLTSFTNKYYKVKSNTTEFAYAWSNMVLYMVSAIDAYAYQSRMKILRPKKSTKDIRLALISSGYTFNAKMAMLEAVKRKIDIKDVQDKWEISDRDCRKLHRDLQDPEIAKCIRRRLKGIPKGFDFDWHDTFKEVHQKILKHIKFRARKKLTFIARSHSVHISEFYSELEESAVKSFFKLWPTSNTLPYIVNYLKKSIDNRVTNIIKSETTLKRGRKINVGKDASGHDQFVLLEANAATLGPKKDHEGMEFRYEDQQSESDRHEGAFKFEIQISVKQILEKYKDKPKKYAYLLILLGHEDASFTKWLRQHKLASATEDNVDVQERTSSDDFNRYLSKYFHLSERTSNVFLMKIKNQLGYENSERLTA